MTFGILGTAVISTAKGAGTAPWTRKAAGAAQISTGQKFLLTKRPQRVSACRPEDWGNGWENVFFHVACENQIRAEERIPFLLSLPFRHKGVFCTPLLGPISLRFQAHLQWMRGL